MNEPSSNSKRVAVIGGGIAGLSVAYYLQKNGATPTVFEASDRFGGKMVTRKEQGCLLEGGPDSLLTEKPWALDLCKELGLEDQLLPSNDDQRSFSILHKGRLHPFPAGCKLFIPQKVGPILTTPLLSPAGRARMLMEPFLRYRVRTEDESLADFTRRHFGREVLERLAGPLLGGIYGGDPEDMSMAATFPRLVNLEKTHGSLVKGMSSLMKQAKARQKAGTAPALFTSLKDGMQTLPDALVEHLESCLRPNNPVTLLDKTPEGWEVNGKTYDAVVIALPAAKASPLLAGIDPESSRMLAQQSSSSSATLSLVFDKKDLEELPKGFGFMSAHPLNNLLVGCTWTGNKFSGREAADRFVCRLFLGGPFAREAIESGDDEALISSALDALRKICPFIPGTPLSTWLQPWPHGNPGYHLGHLTWLASVTKRGLNLGDLHYCGSSYDGVSVSDCVKQAQETVDKIQSV